MSTYVNYMVCGDEKVDSLFPSTSKTNKTTHIHLLHTRVHTHVRTCVYVHTVSDLSSLHLTQKLVQDTTSPKG